MLKRLVFTNAVVVEFDLSIKSVKMCARPSKPKKNSSERTKFQSNPELLLLTFLESAHGFKKHLD